VSKRMLYICTHDDHLALFAGCLTPIGIGQLSWVSQFSFAAQALDEKSYDLVIVHGAPHGAPVDDTVLHRLHDIANAPIILLGHDPARFTPIDYLTVIAAPFTAADLAKAAANALARPQNPLVDRLLQAPGFERFTHDAVGYLLGRADAVQLGAGELLFRQGDPGEAMYFVLMGELAVAIDGRQVAQVEQGGLFGEMSMLQGNKRSATLTAEADSVLLKVGAAQLQNADADFRAVFFELLTRTLIARLKTANQRITNLTGVKRNKRGLPSGPSQ
jgi:hypothetical protein